MKRDPPPPAVAPTKKPLRRAPLSRAESSQPGSARRAESSRPPDPLLRADAGQSSSGDSAQSSRGENMLGRCAAAAAAAVPQSWSASSSPAGMPGMGSSCPPLGIGGRNGGLGRPAARGCVRALT